MTNEDDDTKGLPSKKQKVVSWGTVDIHDGSVDVKVNSDDVNDTIIDINEVMSDPTISLVDANVKANDVIELFFVGNDAETVRKQNLTCYRPTFTHQLFENETISFLFKDQSNTAANDLENVLSVFIRLSDLSHCLIVRSLVPKLNDSNGQQTDIIPRAIHLHTDNIKNYQQLIVEKVSAAAPAPHHFWGTYKEILQNTITVANNMSTLTPTHIVYEENDIESNNTANKLDWQILDKIGFNTPNSHDHNSGVIGRLVRTFKLESSSKLHNAVTVDANKVRFITYDTEFSLYLSSYKLFPESWALLKKAEKLGVPIITEDEFLKMIDR